MLGGHSGINIINGRPVPDDWASVIFHDILDNKITFHLKQINSGTSFNIIPTLGEYSILVSISDISKTKLIINNSFYSLRKTYEFLNLHYSTLSIIEKDSLINYSCFSYNDTIQLISSLLDSFHGIQYLVDGSVYRSQNRARTIFNGTSGFISIQFMTRTHLMSDFILIRRKYKVFANIHNFDRVREENYDYPWFCNETSTLFLTYIDSYKDIVGEKPKRVPFHAVIEASKFVERGYLDVNVMNFGADILNAHTVGESIKVDSTNSKTDVIRYFLQKFSDPNFIPKTKTATKGLTISNKINSYLTTWEIALISSNLILILIIIIGFILIFKKNSEDSPSFSEMKKQIV